MIEAIGSPVAITGGPGLLTALLGFGILVVTLTFIALLWVTYREWQTGALW